MGSLHRRTGALEEYIESQVAERMRLEVEALLNVLEPKLTREEFKKVDGSAPKNSVLLRLLAWPKASRT